MQGPLPSFIDPQDLAVVQQRRSRLYRLARDDVNAFATAVMRDEVTGTRLRQAPVHEVWQELADQHDRLLIWSHIESGKTTQVSVIRTLWELGRDPTLRFGIVSNTHGQAAKIMRSVRSYVESSDALHAVFPELIPDDSLWTASSIVVRRPVVSKDPSVQAFGVHGNVTGARLDRIILDDVLDFENARTPAAREDLWGWYHSAVAGRLTSRGRVICVGTAYHPDDFMHRFARQVGPDRSYRYPVLEDASGLPRWPERWPAERVEAKRRELTPIEFARQMLCVARDDASSRFKQAWIDECLRGGNELPAKLRGVCQWVGPRCLGITTTDLPPGFKTYTGVDLAVQQKDSADLTVFFTILRQDDDSRVVLDIEAGRWSGPEIVAKIVDVHRRYKSLVIVENNAAQDFILQFTRASHALPMRPFTTGRNKAHPEFGIESLAAEMANGKWHIPTVRGAPSPEAGAWINEMLQYTPDQHTGDRLMACIAPGHLVTTDRGLVPIQEVGTHDKVLTHRGRWREVTGTSCRDWSGSAVVLKPRGMRPIVMTPEHPVWSSPAVFERERRTNRMIPKDDGWVFRDAAELRVGRKSAGDFILAPAAAWPGTCGVQMDDGLAFLSGLYLAEGWASDHQASFAFNARETYLVELVRREAARLWGANTSEYRKEGHGGVTACVQSKAASDFFRRFGKRDTKALPWDWMSMSARHGLLVVRGWLVGDGSVSESARGVRHLRGVSVSRGLIYQMQQFLWRAGLLPSTCPFAQPATFRGKPCGHLPAQMLSLSERDCAELLSDPLPEEVERWGRGWRARERTNCCSVPTPTGVAVKVASIERVPYDGQVFNLHVAEDESFVVEGVAAHNSWFSREAIKLGEIKAEVGRLDLTSR